MLAVIFTFSLSITAFAANEVTPSAINGYGIKITNVTSTATSLKDIPTITIVGENLLILSEPYRTTNVYYGKVYRNIVVEAPSIMAVSCLTCNNGVEVVSSSTELVFKMQGAPVIPASINYSGDLNIFLSSGTEAADSKKGILGKINLSTGIFTEGDKVVPDALQI